MKRKRTTSSDSSSSNTESIREAFKRRKRISPAELLNRIVRYIICSMSPIRTVEEPTFPLLLREVSSIPDLTIPCRQTVSNEITSLYYKWKNDLKTSFKTIKYVCQTADVWSTRTRSFMGITVHWIDEKLKRKSELLTCRRFPGAHNFDRIAKMIYEINKEFGLRRNQIVATVTDNGSNFVKAFKEFSIELHLPNDDGTDLTDENLVADSGSESEDEGDLEFLGVPELCFTAIFSEPQIFRERDEDDEDSYDFETEDTIQLSEHVRCAVHTLNLIPTTDVKKLFKENAMLNNDQIIKTCKLFNKPTKLSICKFGPTVSGTAAYLIKF